ncbi:hypothetical protein CFC21_109781 [Triticum aestivum]|uniref:RING-type E3 ubiquitin transferase n=3 Tax=Triticinae TaxID=1648030 RepID=A0A3B6TLR7_WHEAT|nr:RING-H2 finger protein ATL32-like [Aegilops tauschii subsp. strangulata]XP_044439503.1 RING-H2 finger protein ATL32-like [Triticum aestivum]KAF7109538.1 hypothetical protein CFC21_109781 [Triticum aestivum]
MPFPHPAAHSPAPPPSHPWPSGGSSKDDSASQGGIIAGLVIGFVASLLLFTVAWSVFKGHRNSRARARAAAAAAARPWPPPEPYRPRSDEDRHRRSASDPSQTARLPAFTYSPSVKHNVAGGGEEAATCSVCLGAFLLGETVRLLPVCLHLYHVGCIDPWLDAHSTCPLCRSDTDPTIDAVRILPV